MWYFIKFIDWFSNLRFNSYVKKLKRDPYAVTHSNVYNISFEDMAKRDLEFETSYYKIHYNQYGIRHYINCETGASGIVSTSEFIMHPEVRRIMTEMRTWFEKNKDQPFYD